MVFLPHCLLYHQLWPFDEHQTSIHKFFRVCQVGVKCQRSMTSKLHSCENSASWISYKSRVLREIRQNGGEEQKALRFCRHDATTWESSTLNTETTTTFSAENVHVYVWVSWPLKMGPIGCPEIWVRNYHYSLCNSPADSSFHVQGRLTQRIFRTFLQEKLYRTTHQGYPVRHGQTNVNTHEL